MSFSKSKLSPVQRAALKVVQAEMRSYDLLSKRSRLVYERSVSRAIDASALTPSYTCGHGVMLYEPCDKCTRTEQECEVYRRDAERRIKELLAILDTK